MERLPSSSILGATAALTDQSRPLPHPKPVRGTAQATVSFVRAFQINAHRQELPMQNSARLFICVQCRSQVWICRHCDRGNVYCSKQCSGPARCESLREAGRRYQSGRCGRFRHAERQRQYRARTQIVTHQGSADAPPDDVLAREFNTAPMQRFSPAATGAQGLHCHFCQRACSPLVRLDFLHRNSELRSIPWIRPPPDG